MGKLSRLSDVTYNTIRTLYRHPEGGVNIQTLYRIAKALDVSVADLIEEIHDPTNCFIRYGITGASASLSTASSSPDSLR